MHAPADAPLETATGTHLAGVLYQSWPQPDGTLRLEYLSAGAGDLLELSADELALRLNTRTLPLFGVNREEFYRTVEESMQEGTSWHAEVGYVGPRTGQRRWLQLADFPRQTEDGIPFFSGVIVDCTELKLAEERSRRAYRNLSAHLQNTPLAVVEWTADRTFVRWSGQAEKLFGWTALEVVGRPLDLPEFVHPDDRERVGEVIAKLLDGRELRNVCVNRNVGKGGRVVTCEWHNSVVRDDRTGEVSILSLVQDLTGQRAVEAELQLSEERLKTALRFSRMMVWEFDPLSERAIYSQHFGEFFDHPHLGASPLRADARTVVHPDDRPRLTSIITAAIERGNGSEYEFEFRGSAPAADGTERWYHNRGRVIVGAGGQAMRVVGVLADITDRKRVEREKEALDLQQSEARRYESLGVMAGGIAHDFNNLLTVILGNATVARMDLPSDSPVIGCLNDIETACQRAANLCSQMSAYAGVGRLSVGAVDVADLLRHAEPVFRADAGRTPIVLQVRGTPLAVTGEPFQIRQAVRNLIVNATEAIGGTAGRIVVEVDEADVPAENTGYHLPPKSGRYVRVRVTDTGPGMSADVAARAFDPFFSTKFAGRGLGLAAVRGIAKSHNGAVRLTSTPGGGTAVEVLFPVNRNGAPAVAAVVPVSTGSSVVTQPTERTHITAGGTALVADDEANIRELMASLLEDNGLEVVVAENGTEAVRLFDAAPERFTLAVVDLMMPGLNGHEVIRRMRAKRPGLPAVIASGYIDTELPADIRTGGPTGVLPKPFRLEQLTSVVTALLGRV